MKKPAQTGNQSYLQLLQTSDEAKKSQDIQSTVEHKELELRSDILATKRALSAEEKKRKTMLQSESLCFNELSKCDDEIESLQKGLARLETYLTELF